jgi:hypothetical protein
MAKSSPPANFPSGNGLRRLELATIQIPFTFNPIILLHSSLGRVTFSGGPGSAGGCSLEAMEALGSTRKPAKWKKTSVPPTRRALFARSRASRPRGLRFCLPGASAPACVLPGRRALLPPRSSRVGSFHRFPMLSNNAQWIANEFLQFSIDFQ